MRANFTTWPATLAAAAILLTAISSTAADPPPPRSPSEIKTVLAKAPPVAGPLRNLEIVLLADVKDHGPGEHDYPLWQKRWKVLLGGKADGQPLQANLHGGPQGDPNLLASGAANLKVATAWKWPTPDQFRTADLIVAFCYPSTGKQRAWSEPQMRQLADFLDRGRGLVVIHSATYTTLSLVDQPQHPRIALTGLVFDKGIRYRHGPIEMKIAQPSHPICLGLPPTIRFIDEPYWPPQGDLGKVTVLATSDEQVENGNKPQPQPIFWTYTHGKGRVYGCVLGHYNWTFDDPLFRILLLRGMSWAAGQSPYRLDTLVLR